MEYGNDRPMESKLCPVSGPSNPATLAVYELLNYTTQMLNPTHKNTEFSSAFGIAEIWDLGAGLTSVCYFKININPTNNGRNL